MIKRTDSIGQTAADMRTIAQNIKAAARDTVKNTRVNGVALDIFAKKKPLP